MCTCYIYMIELRLEDSENGEESLFYIGKTREIVDRLITHVSRNKKTTKLIRDKEKKRNIARVVAIREIHKIIFSKDEMDLIKDKECIKCCAKMDSITSKIENKFVYDTIVNKKDNIDENKRIYRGGHYTSKWDNSSELYKIKHINKYKSYEMELLFDGIYMIDEKFYDEYSQSEKNKYIEEIKVFIKKITGNSSSGCEFAENKNKG